MGTKVIVKLASFEKTAFIGALTSLAANMAPKLAANLPKAVGLLGSKGIIATGQSIYQGSGMGQSLVNGAKRFASGAPGALIGAAI